MIRNLMFDADGTLWDSAPPVTDSWNEVLKKYPETAHIRITAQDMYRYMGHTMIELCCKMLPIPDDAEAAACGMQGDPGHLCPALTPARRREIMQECMDFELEWLEQHSGVFYPRVRETLEALKAAGCRLFIVSNCQDGYIQVLMRQGRLEALIEDFESYGRTQEDKAANIRRVMARCGLKPEETVYVGDTAMDEAAADGAGIAFWHASYGFGTADHPAAVLKAFEALPGLAKAR